MNRTIEETCNVGLCTGCGTCVGLCPNSAIEMIRAKGIYIPRLNRQRCNRCGICFNVCPGYVVDFKSLNLAIFGKEPQEILGNYVNCYIGHASDLSTRHNSASGGLVTALLIFAIEEGIIDGALVTKMSEKKPFEPEVYIARTSDEVFLASKSKYCPVPANIVLKEILGEDGKFAVVGLPCHIQGIRKAEILDRKLFKKIILHLGLICNHAPTFLATEYLLQKMKLTKEDVRKIDYRSEGWPGGLSIRLKNGSKEFISLNSPFYWGHVFNSYFYTTHCILCDDKICGLSDISFGDAWLPELKKNKMGESIIISRTIIAEELLENAMSKRKIELNKTSSNKVIESQSLYSVKKRLKARILVSKMLGKKVPFYNQELLESQIYDYLNAMLVYLQTYISSKKYLWNLIDLYPFLLRYIRRT